MKKGRTNLLNQWKDFCDNCPHKSKSYKSGLFHLDDIYCAKHDKFMNIAKLKKSRVFCYRGK
jgi:hypothetical protein